MIIFDMKLKNTNERNDYFSETQRPVNHTTVVAVRHTTLAIYYYALEPFYNLIISHYH